MKSLFRGTTINQRARHKSFGLVLAGGGARGLSHAGVLKALNHWGYFPSAVAGVSMGAVVGATYALNDDWYDELVAMDVSGFPTLPEFRTPGVAKMFKNLMLAEKAGRDLYFGLGAGQDSVGWGRDVLRNLVRGKSLQNGRIPIYTCATDILTGKRVVTSEGDAVDAIYASSALAGLLPPLELNSHILIDGGYSDVAPVDILRDRGLDFVIAVDPGQRRVDAEPKNGLEVLLRSIEITQNAFAGARLAKADLVFKPKFKHSVGVMAFKHKRECIAAGISAVRRRKVQLHEMLGVHRRW